MLVCFALTFSFFYLWLKISFCICCTVSGHPMIKVAWNGKRRFSVLGWQRHAAILMFGCNWELTVELLAAVRYFKRLILCLACFLFLTNKATSLITPRQLSTPLQLSLSSRWAEIQLSSVVYLWAACKGNSKRFFKRVWKGDIAQLSAQNKLSKSSRGILLSIPEQQDPVTQIAMMTRISSKFYAKDLKCRPCFILTALGRLGLQARHAAGR